MKKNNNKWVKIPEWPKVIHMVYISKWTKLTKNLIIVKLAHQRVQNLEMAQSGQMVQYGKDGPNHKTLEFQNVCKSAINNCQTVSNCMKVIKIENAPKWSKIDKMGQIRDKYTILAKINWPLCNKLIENH